MRASEPETFLDGLYFPECLRWRDGQLWFSDMFAGTVNVVRDPRDPTPSVFFAPDDLCGGLGWLPDGTLLVVSMEARHLYAVDASGAARLYVDLARAFDHPINDLYVDAAGRAFVSGYGYDVDNGAPQQPVPLAVVTGERLFRLDDNPLLFPNGIDLLDPSTLVVAETFADRVSSLSVGLDGSLGVATTFATMAPGDGPDGISSDGHGGLWVACAFGERVVHLDATGGIVEEIVVPGMGVYDCLLGGPDGRTLYIAVASHDEVHARRHPTGSILRARVGS